MNWSPPQLAGFLEIAKLGGFTEAARRLGVSQPTLSRTIRALEDELGAKLFDRDTRNVTLTPAGYELRPIAERLLSDLDTAAADMSAFVQGRGGLIRIAVVPSLAAHLLPLAIVRFTAAQPGVRFRLSDAPVESVLDTVIRGAADFGLTVRPLVQPGLRFRALTRDRLGLVCRRDDPLASSHNLDWSAFVGRPFVAMAPFASVRTMTDSGFQQAGLAVEPLYECSFLGSAGALVEAGLGITALPQLTFNMASTPDLTWKPLRRPALHREIGILTRAGRTHSPAVVQFMDVLGQIVGEKRAAGLGR